MNILLLPIHIDMQYLTEPTKVVQANADFSRLPHVSEGRNSIDLPDPSATPLGVQLIREGWLRLSPNDTPPTPDEPEES